MTTKQKVYETRPYTIINCAMSVDGKIALPSGKPIKLSSLEDFKRVHELRNYCDGILVGINTILMDDPKLTVKPEFVTRPNHPTRIILDYYGRTPKNAAVLDGVAPTLIFIGEENESKNYKFRNAEVSYSTTGEAGMIKLDEMLLKLKHRGINNLLVEGGETVIYNFLQHHLVDELYVYVSNIVIGGTSAPTLAGGLGAKSEEDIIKLKLISNDRLGEGVLLKYLVI